MRRYLKSVKESVCKQILDVKLSISEIATKNNILHSTVATWKKKLFKAKGIKNNGFSAEQEVSEFCRKKGMYSHMLKK